MRAEYLPALIRRGAMVAFACDIEIGKREIPPGALTYRSLQEIPNGNVGDVVLATLPHNLYASTIELLLMRGYRNIVIEKPAALSLDEFKRVSEAIERTTGNVFVLSRRRFAGSYVALKRLLHKGRTLHAFTINISRTFGKSSYGWRRDPAVAGKNVLFDLGYHAIDLAFWLFDQPTLVEVTKGPRPEVDGADGERASIRLSFLECPTPLDIYVDRMAPSPFEQTTIFTDDQILLCTPLSLVRHTINGGGDIWYYQSGGEAEKMIDDIESFLRDPTADRSTSLYLEHYDHIKIASSF